MASKETDTAPLVVAKASVVEEANEEVTATAVQPERVSTVQGNAVEVTAPADLQGGYMLNINVGGTVRTVRVPEGGVREGQIFYANLIEGGAANFIPTGNWRDGLCDCCRYGCCHPLLCMGWCLEPILAGQVMTRMSRSWLGGPGARPSVSNTCCIVTGMFVFVSFGQIIMNFIISIVYCGGDIGGYFIPLGTPPYILCPDNSVPDVSSGFTIVYTIIGTLSGLFGIYLLIAVCRTRAAMRRKYNIPNKNCGGCEDCCCATFCSCCTVLQMARHTHDYAAHDVGCCSDTCFNKRGQPDNIPEIDP